MRGEIFTAKEAAEFFGISLKTMYDWVHIEGFPALKIGNIIRIPKDLLIDWVEAQATK